MPLRITLLRHAKSSQDYIGANDFFRPLNKRGEEESRLMGKLLKKKKYKPEVIFSSKAERTKITAKNFAEELGLKSKYIHLKEDMYLASAQSLLNMSIKISANYKNIMLVGHNPGITDFINLVSDAQIQNLPTCGIVSILLKSNEWRDLLQPNSEIDWSLCPKKDLVT
ncbi:MAG: histidine phosphatase family protein [Pseudomonadota bacterium]|nr:histidine phosphatase family protein [Pseudomonadota bacterium]